MGDEAPKVIRRDEPFTCITCDKTFESKEVLKIHKQKDHGMYI
jgi:hypothetical protein